MSWQIYQAPDVIVVKNHPRIEDNTIPLLVASLERYSNFIHIYGKKKELLFYNNRQQLFDQATEIDMLNLYTVFSYLQKLYTNTRDAIDIILNIYTKPTPGLFSLFTVNTETEVQFMVFPVLTNGNLLGVVVTDDLQHRRVGTNREHADDNTQPWGVEKAVLPALQDFI